MVQALDDGVKGGKWYSLWDKILTPEVLEAAYAKVKANDGAAGVDHVSVDGFEQDKVRNLTALYESLKDGTYRPCAIRRCFIPKAGSTELRPLGIPTVRDRVVQTALRDAVDPIFEREFADHSYGFRPRRSAHQALDRVEHRLGEGFVWVADVDLQSYFDTIPHAALMAKVRERVADGRVLGLIEAFLTQPVEDGDRRQIPRVGVPQGAVVSPVLSNVYLDPLDHRMARAGFAMTRYADDFVVQCQSEEEARRALVEVTRWCGEAGLTVHPTKTRIVRVSVTEGFDFLGYHFRQHRDDPRRVKMWPRDKSAAKLRATLRPLTKRCNGHALAEIVRRVNVVLRGFFAYFRKSVATPLRELDQWLRGRLRSLLRRRRKRRGRGRGADHQRWPNAFFEDLGLFSMARALEQTAHPPRG
jgi:RNA-directed DNA polymerase